MLNPQTHNTNFVSVQTVLLKVRNEQKQKLYKLEFTVWQNTQDDGG